MRMVPVLASLLAASPDFADPVADISLTRKVDFVMKDGVPVSGSFGID